MLKSDAKMNLAATKVFPRLMVGRQSKCIILFTAHGQGVVVKADSESPWGVGHYDTGWAMENFEPWFGTITLTQD